MVGHVPGLGSKLIAAITTFLLVAGAVYATVVTNPISVIQFSEPSQPSYTRGTSVPFASSHDSEYYRSDANPNTEALNVPMKNGTYSSGGGTTIVVNAGSSSHTWYGTDLSTWGTGYVTISGGTHAYSSYGNYGTWAKTNRSVNGGTETSVQFVPSSVTIW